MCLGRYYNQSYVVHAILHRCTTSPRSNDITSSPGSSMAFKLPRVRYVQTLCRIICAQQRGSSVYTGSIIRYDAQLNVVPYTGSSSTFSRSAHLTRWKQFALPSLLLPPLLRRFREHRPAHDCPSFVVLTCSNVDAPSHRCIQGREGLDGCT